MNSATRKRLEAVSRAFQSGKAQDLKRIGTDTIKDAVMLNDKDIASVSVIAYALYKMLSKDHFVHNKRWPKVRVSIIQAISKSAMALEKNDEDAFRRGLASVTGEIEHVDEQLSNFARSIHEKAMVKQASTAYALGLSIGQAAWLTGADKNEVQKYVGFTRIHDEQPVKKSISERLKTLREQLA